MNTFKEKMAFAVPVAVITGTTMVSFAEDTAGSANQALVSGATNAVSQVTANINAVIPIALGVLGTVLAVKLGIKLFKSFVKTSAS